MKNEAKISYLWLVLFSVFIIACGGDKKNDPVAVINVDISKLNTFTSQYTITSAQPASKPESNYPPSNTYTFTLTSVAGSYIAPSMPTTILSQENSLTTKKPAYGTGQVICDNIMRQKENELLASGKSQLSKKYLPGIYRSAPSNPVIDSTSWSDVWILNSATTMTKITTTCRAITTHAYFFIDDNDSATISGHLSDYCTAFELIYAIIHSKFGEENDVDSNSHVIIVFSSKLENITGLLGYFYSADKYANNATTNPNSNEGDIFYMTTASAYQGDIIKGTLAHEFQHMIYFDEHVNSGVTSTYTWLNEALSQAAEYYNGYDSSTSNHISWIKSYLTGNNWEGLSLTHWTDDNYGYGAIFIRYLIDQYGDTAIKNMCSTANIGIHAVEIATGVDFNTIFNNFTKALVLSDVASNTNSLYKFTTLDLETVQTTGRKGLTTLYIPNAGKNYDWWLYAYEIWFVDWAGTFKSMTVTGNNIVCMPIGYN